MATIDEDIDRLYQIGLGAFVAERNALAKRAKRPDVKGLEKPGVPAWAINQLYWHERAAFDRLVAASEALQAAHRALLAGEAADVRGAEAAHREALRAAVAAARGFLAEGGHGVSPATLDAVSRTLEALPHPAANGRLTTMLTPRGLDALAGVTLAEPRQPAPVEPQPARPPTSTVDDDGSAAAHTAALAARRQVAEAELASARTTLAAAEARLEEAERDVAIRRRERDSARQRLDAALSTARALGDIE